MLDFLYVEERLGLKSGPVQLVHAVVGITMSLEPVSKLIVMV